MVPPGMPEGKRPGMGPRRPHEGEWGQPPEGCPQVSRNRSLQKWGEHRRGQDSAHRVANLNKMSPDSRAVVKGPCLPRTPQLVLSAPSTPVRSALRPLRVSGGCSARPRPGTGGRYTGARHKLRGDGAAVVRWRVDRNVVKLRPYRNSEGGTHRRGLSACPRSPKAARTISGSFLFSLSGGAG